MVSGRGQEGADVCFRALCIVFFAYIHIHIHSEQISKPSAYISARMAAIVSLLWVVAVGAGSLAYLPMQTGYGSGEFCGDGYGEEAGTRP